MITSLYHTFRKMQYSDAVEYFTTCAKINPAHPDAVNNIAYIYNVAKNYQGTIDICEAAAKEAKGVKNYYRNWAIALLAVGKIEEAEKIMREVVEIDTDERMTTFFEGLNEKKNRRELEHIGKNIGCKK